MSDWNEESDIDFDITRTTYRAKSFEEVLKMLEELVHPDMAWSFNLITITRDNKEFVVSAYQD